MPEKLKPCPFCGSEALTEETIQFKGYKKPIQYYNYCTNVGGCGVDMGWFDTEQEAIEAWNKREGE